ncbi:MAG: plastocyanin/azurin family copper-binding protein [Vicinamibacteria bacterium]
MRVESGSAHEVDVVAAAMKYGVPAGKVAVTAKNEGKEKHELIALRTDLAIDKFPVVDGKVDENKLEGTDEIDGLDPGKSETKTFDLPAGRYVFYCNQPKHYEQGMRTELIVK